VNNAPTVRLVRQHEFNTSFKYKRSFAFGPS